MSLEAKIEVLNDRLTLLTTHIEKLTAALCTGEQDLAASGLYAGEEVAVKIEAPEVKEETPKSIKEEAPATDTTAEPIDFETFKRLCLDAARDPKIGKTHVKEVIASFGAKKALDVKETERRAVLNAIGVGF